MNTKECLEMLSACKDVLRRDFGIVSMQLFGSMARGEQQYESDIDLFVDTTTPNAFILMDAKDFLEKQTGRRVDIVRNHKSLNPKLRNRIEQDGISVF